MSIDRIGSIGSIVFVFIDAINYIDPIYCINLINPDVLNCIILQLKDNENDLTNSGMTFGDKKGGLFDITGIYWYL